jgi:predicted enzyme related to lactoylglutathione lyase
MANAVSWFEIPTADFQRAIQFYNNILGINLVGVDAGAIKMAVFPHENGAGGALVHHENYVPSFNGTTVYLTVAGDIAPVLAKIEELGGSLVISKTALDTGGFFAQFTDSEGNRVGLMSHE